MNRLAKFLMLSSLMAAIGYWAGAHQTKLLESYAKAITHISPAFLSQFLARAETKIASGPVIYYRDPDGMPLWSQEPKKTPDGRDFVAVLASEDISFSSEKILSASVPDPGAKKIRFYRNPMGLPDTSLQPKKDSMGMDYIPVYEGEESIDGSLKITPERIQRTGVRSEPVAMHTFSTPLHTPGTIQIDERRQSVTSLRFEGWIEKIEDVTTGTVLKKGQPLFRVYGSDLAVAAAQYVSILGSSNDATMASQKGARRKLENLGVPDGIIAELARSREIPTSFTWPAPRDGVVIERNISEGMRAMPGDALFKVADVSVVWAIAEVSERDLGLVVLGQQVQVRPRGTSGKVFTGRIAVIYPSVTKETRTARIRIELANPGSVLKPDMYVDVDIAAGSDAPMVAVPASAVIDSGERQVVIVDRGDGKFESRVVRTGQRGDGFVEIREGLVEGDKIVTSANFLIDAESNLKAALQGLAPAGETK